MDGAVGVAPHAGARGHIGLLAAIDFLRVLELCAALPELGDEGVTRLRHRAGAPIASDIERVGVEPIDTLLACGQAEAAVDERFRLVVELADFDRVFAAVGELNEAARFLRLKAGCALVDPVRVLGLGECVDVEHRFPFRFGVRIVLQRRAADQATDVHVVLPEIVEGAGAKARHRDAVFRFQDRQRLRVKVFVARVGLQDFQAALVLRTHPVQRLLALDLFKPEKRIGGFFRHGDS